MPRILNEEMLLITDSEGRGELVPERLAEKLLQIREARRLSQGEMLRVINPTETDENNRARVSQYELGKRVPSLIEVREYARFAGVPMETLVDDKLDLPDPDGQAEFDDCYSVCLSETAVGHCKEIYLEQLGGLPLHRMSLLPTDKFLTQLLLAACDDYNERGTGSALTRRVRYFFSGGGAKVKVIATTMESGQPKTDGTTEADSDYQQ